MTVSAVIVYLDGSAVEVFNDVPVPPVGARLFGNVVKDVDWRYVEVGRKYTPGDVGTGKTVHRSEAHVYTVSPTPLPER